MATKTAPKTAPKTANVGRKVRVAKAPKTEAAKAPKTTDATAAYVASLPKKKTAAQIVAERTERFPGARIVPSGYVTQSSVAAPLAIDAKGSPLVGASVFTTQTQRRALRAIASGAGYDFSAPASLRTRDRLVDLGLVVVAKTGSVSLSAKGRGFVASIGETREGR